jgi:hypothetical protein
MLNTVQCSPGTRAPVAVGIGHIGLDDGQIAFRVGGVADPRLDEAALLSALRFAA